MADVQGEVVEEVFRVIQYASTHENYKAAVGFYWPGFIHTLALSKDD